MLNPSLLTQSHFAAKSTTISLSLYKVGKFMTNSNYRVQKVGTLHTQCANRIRLRPITPIYDVDDSSVTKDDFRPDPNLGKYRSEHEFFDSATEQPFEDTTFFQFPDTLQKRDDKVQDTIRGAIAGPAVAAPAVAHVVAPAGSPAQADAPKVPLGAGKVPPFPTRHAPEPKTPVEQQNPNFSEAKLQMTPTQVPDDISQRGVPAHETVSRLTD